MSTPSPRALRRPPGWERVNLLTVGIVLFIGSELMFFSALFGMYYQLRSINEPHWPPPGIKLDLLEPSVFTAILLLSSLTMQYAVHKIKQGDRRGMMSWIWVTIFLGLVFLAGQGHGYYRDNFDISTNAYGSAHVVMTGFHALHVFAGLLVMLVILGRASVGAYSKDDHAGVEVAAYYWHFVDLVWVGLYTTLFVIR